MYRIALCDDKPTELNKVEALLDEYKKTIVTVGLQSIAFLTRHGVHP